MPFAENLQTKYRLVTERTAIILVVTVIANVTIDYRKALQKFSGGLSICIFY
jgi:hypothetical protein